MQVKELIRAYGEHLQKARGVAESTRHQYIHYVQRFLSETFTDVFPDKLRDLQPSQLIQYVIKQKEHHHEPVLKSMLTALRSFLRYLQMKGLCKVRLVDAVPSLAAWKLSRIPNYLTKEQLRKFLASFDRKTPTGRRDYAIALCLARLGLRGKEGVLYIFIKLSRKLGWRDRDKKPRIHDFRHTFAVRRLLKWYEEGANLDQKILALSTYLGHVQVTDTYWYLSAVPELLAIVSEKFENFASKERRRDNL